MRISIFKLLTLVLVGFVLYIAINLSRFTGIYQTHAPKLGPLCDKTYTLWGAEDFVSLPGEGVFISATDRLERDPSFVAGIYWLANGTDTPVLVSQAGPEKFFPHGMDLLDLGEKRLLYVVNHSDPVFPSPDAQHTIEVFDVGQGGALTHVRSIDFNALVYPNNIAVLDEDRFFVTDSWEHLDGIMHVLENYLSLPLTELAFYDRGEISHVASGLNFANGVALTQNKTQLWVAESRGRKIRSYQIDQASGELTPLQTYPVSTSPDNITVRPDGNLLIAGIPNALKFEVHAKGDAAPIPSQIFVFDPETEQQENIFYDESGLISGATVGLEHDGRLFIGTAFDDVAISCPIS